MNVRSPDRQPAKLIASILTLLTFPLAALLVAWSGDARSTAVLDAVAPQPPADRIWNSLTQTFDRLKERPPKEVLESVVVIIHDPNFRKMDSRKQFTALIQAGELAAQIKQFDQAVQLFSAATLVDPNNKNVWLMRLEVGIIAKSPDQIVALTGIAERWPDVARSINDATIESILNTAHQSSDPAEMQLLESLFSARWSPSDPLESASYYWRDLTLLQLKAGRQDRALLVARTITDPYAIISMRVDYRFDALEKLDPDVFDVERVAKAQLEDLQARALTADNSLEIVNGVSIALIQRNRPAEALALTDQLIERLSDSDKAAKFVDLHNERPWTRNYRAYALFDLGRADEGLAEMKRAADPASGDVIFSQAINLADALNEAGQPNEALKAISFLPPSDDAGKMEIEEVKVCAYSQQGDFNQINDSLDYLEKNADEDFSALEMSLLCANKENVLANIIIDRLRNERYRADALMLVQQYERPKFSLFFRKILETRRAAVLNRADVSLAVRDVGRVEAWSLQAEAR